MNAPDPGKTVLDLLRQIDDHLGQIAEDLNEPLEHTRWYRETTAEHPPALPPSPQP